MRFVSVGFPLKSLAAGALRKRRRTAISDVNGVRKNATLLAGPIDYATDRSLSRGTTRDNDESRILRQRDKQGVLTTPVSLGVAEFRIADKNE